MFFCESFIMICPTTELDHCLFHTIECHCVRRWTVQLEMSEWNYWRLVQVKPSNIFHIFLCIFRITLNNCVLSNFNVNFFEKKISAYTADYNDRQHFHLYSMCLMLHSWGRHQIISYSTPIVH